MVDKAANVASDPAALSLNIADLKLQNPIYFSYIKPKKIKKL